MDNGLDIKIIIYSKKVCFQVFRMFLSMFNTAALSSVVKSLIAQYYAQKHDFIYICQL